MLYNLINNSDDWMTWMGIDSVLQVILHIEFRAFTAVILSFLFVLLLGKRTIHWLMKQKIGDSPEFNHVDVNRLMASKATTPTMGGVLICGSILVTTLLLADLGSRYVHLAILVLVWLAALGSADDWLKLTSARRTVGSRVGLYAWEKLLFQLGIGAIVGVALYKAGLGEDGAHVLTLPFQRTYAPNIERLLLEPGVIVLGMPVFVLLATLLVAGTSNAVNITDGMDGLAAGTTVIAAFTMMVLCYIAGASDRAGFMLVPNVPGTGELMVVAGAMAGACLGFLWFNCAPAQVFMGDTGSLPLGGLLAYMAVAVRQELLLIVIGGVYFLEIGSVILQVGYFKSTGGKRILRCSPIHHHFHLTGWSESQIVTRFWVLAVICAVAAIASLKMR